MTPQNPLELLSFEMGKMKRMICHLEARSVFLEASSKSIEAFLLKRLSLATGEDLAHLSSELLNLKRKVYDEAVEEVKLQNPYSAKWIDARDYLEGKERYHWFFPDDDIPN